MNFSYEENEMIFKEYVNKCKQRINELTFSKKEISNYIPIKQDMIKKGIINSNTKIEEAIKIHKKHMIDVKLDHTMRVVKNATKIANNLRLNKGYIDILKISALLHDIARFEQAIASNDFNDKHCKIFNRLSHAEYGFNMLYKDKKIKEFNVPENYKYTISLAVRYHQLPVLKGDLALKFHHINQLDTSKLTGNENLNNEEKIIVASLIQIVRDADMLDILYEHVTGEFPVINSFLKYRVEKEDLYTISKYFGININEIKQFNKLKSNDISTTKVLSIPTDKINPIILQVPDDIKRKLFNNENIDLKELQNRKDFNFIIGMWWRISHFLNNMTFIVALKIVKETNLLDKIYATYPDKYKPLVRDIFVFAKEKLVANKLKRIDRSYI